MDFFRLKFSAGNLQRLKQLPLTLIILLSAVTCVAASNSLQAAAEQGDSNAQYEIAYSLLQSKEPTPDYVEVVKWLRPAAEKGHAQAQYSLALRYLFGQGVTKNLQTAVEWLQRSADQGFVDAQFSLGLRFYWGQGVKKNLTLAQQWFKKAAQQGQPKANQYLEELQGRLHVATQRTHAQEETKALIADYAQAVVGAASGEKNALHNKQELENKMTASEILLATQLSFRQREQSGDQEMALKLSESIPQLFTAEDYFLAGNKHMHAGQPQLAVANYKKSQEINPDNANSLRNLASAYAQTGNTRAAISSMQKAIVLNPGQAIQHATLGLSYQTEENFSAALSEYRLAARLNPGIGWIYPDMAHIFIQQKNYSAAWKAVRQAEILGHANERLSNQLRKLSPATMVSAETALRAELQLRQIVLPTRQAAESALIELTEGRDFSRMVQRLSLPQYSQNGGYWGPYQPAQLASEFNAALKDLAPLTISPIVATKAGFHILQKFPCFSELFAKR